MAWIQLQFKADADKVEPLSDALSEIGAVAITLLDAADQPLFESSPGDTFLWSQTYVNALFQEEVNLTAILQQLKQHWAPEPFPPVHSKFVADQDWERAWMEHFKPLRFGSKLWICPSWLSISEPEAVTILLDPGLAFGTGTHPTTALCLEWLANAALDQARVIDYGCGSGILAIAALKLGAVHAWAIDHDPQALLATQANAARNGVISDLYPLLPSELGDTSADLLVANILADPLQKLASRFAALVRPEGWLVLSGITEDQAQRLIEAYNCWFSFESPAAKEGWTLLTGCRRST